MQSSRNEIKQKVTQISLQKQEHDQLLLNLQGMLTHPKAAKTSLSTLRHQYAQTAQQLRNMISVNSNKLDELKRESLEIARGGLEMTSTLRSIDSLTEYFRDIGKKVRVEQRKGEDKLSERQRWEITNNEDNHAAEDESSRLVMGINAARETREMAGSVLGSLETQGSRLAAARERMGAVLKNINFSGNIVRLIRTRSKEDTRLIMALTAGLVLQIVLCIYVIRPLVRGS